MNDTHPDIAIQFQDLLMSKSPEKRLLMGCSMYDTAKRIACSAIRNQNPGITNAEMTRHIFLKFYGHEFNEADTETILANLPKPCDA